MFIVNLFLFGVNAILSVSEVFLVKENMLVFLRNFPFQANMETRLSY